MEEFKMKNSKDLAVVILAAGISSRLGNLTKQLLVYKNETLLKIAVKKALEISKDVFVVWIINDIHIKIFQLFFAFFFFMS